MDEANRAFIQQQIDLNRPTVPKLPDNPQVGDGLVWNGTSWVTARGMQQILDIKLTALSATVDTNSFITAIPQMFSHLLITGVADNNTGALGMGIQFNNDSGANYNWLDATAAGTAAVNSNQAVGQTDARYGVSNKAGTHTGGIFTVSIPAYRDTTFKKWFTSETANHDGTNFNRRMITGEWNSTAAITRITFLLEGAGSYTIGSRFTIYGLY